MFHNSPSSLSKCSAHIITTVILDFSKSCYMYRLYATGQWVLFSCSFYVFNDIHSPNKTFIDKHAILYMVMMQTISKCVHVHLVNKINNRITVCVQASFVLIVDCYDTLWTLQFLRSLNPKADNVRTILNSFFFHYILH